LLEVRFRYKADPETPVAKPIKTPSSTWKAVVRKVGWPTASKTFRRKSDAVDWARSIEDQMVKGVYVDRAPSAKETLDKSLLRYLSEVVPTSAGHAALRG
jgi:hypothetical protein